LDRRKPFLKGSEATPKGSNRHDKPMGNAAAKAASAANKAITADLKKDEVVKRQATAAVKCHGLASKPEKACGKFYIAVTDERIMFRGLKGAGSFDIEFKGYQEMEIVQATPSAPNNKTDVMKIVFKVAGGTITNPATDAIFVEWGKGSDDDLEWMHVIRSAYIATDIFA
jgi:hypothetical protein